MMIDTKAIVTATEANQNFSRVAKMAEKKGHVYVFKNNNNFLICSKVFEKRLGARGKGKHFFQLLPKAKAKVIFPFPLYNFNC